MYFGHDLFVEKGVLGIFNQPPRSSTCREYCNYPSRVDILEGLLEVTKKRTEVNGDFLFHEAWNFSEIVLKLTCGSRKSLSNAWEGCKISAFCDTVHL